MTPQGRTMIMLSRLNGLPFALNPDLIERAEATPDTVLTLCDGNKLVIGESVEEVVSRVRDYRASILSLADQVAVAAPGTPAHSPAPALHVVPLHGREA
jgi:flagellar protein FlbD